MIEFLTWRLSGMPFFKDQSFDLSRRGTTLVLGKNLDSTDKDSTNGAGKSFFFNELAELITNKPLIGERQDTVRRGTRELTFKRSNHLYVATRSFSSKGKESLAISKNGKDLEFRELSAAKEYLQKLIPYSEQEVLSLFFIDARVPHPLVRGSSTARREFFLRFFKLESSSHLRKLINAELDEIKRAEGSIDELRNRLRELKSNEDKDPEALKDKLEKNKGRVTILDAQVSRYRKVQSILEAYRESKPVFSALKEFGLSTTKEVRGTIEDLERALSKSNKGLRRWATYRETADEFQDAVTRKRKVAKKLGGDPESFPEQETALRAKYDKRRAAEKAAQSELDAREASLADHQSVVSKLERQIKELKTRIRELKSTSDKCPTCGQAWTNKHAKQELSETQELLEQTQSKLERRTTAVSRLTKAIELDHSDLKALSEKRESLVERLDLFTAYSAIVIPETSEPPSEDETYLKSQVKRLSEQIEQLSSVIAHLPNKVAYDLLTTEDKALATGEDPTERYLAVMQKVAELQVRVSDAESNRKELARTRERLAELKTKVQDKEALELLLQAFSKKGVDAIRLRTITDRLSQLVNKYAKFMYPEDYTFSFELESQFNFLVTRKYGKKTETSDVRKLSGAESLLFNLVLYVSLLSFVPASIRPSVLILDEPTATFGPSFIESFIKFLPVLNQVVPHIIVITPNPQQPYPGAKMYTVVKNKGVSRIVEGSV